MDDTDRKILKLLQENGRLSRQKLAALINMSPPATAERVRKLEEAGVIQGYTVKISPEQIDLPIRAFMVANVPVANRERVYRYLHNSPLVTRMHYALTGGTDVILEIFASVPAELDQLQHDLLHLAQTTTYLVRTQPIKDEPLLPPADRG